MKLHWVVDENSPVVHTACWGLAAVAAGSSRSGNDNIGVIGKWWWWLWSLVLCDIVEGDNGGGRGLMCWRGRSNIDERGSKKPAQQECS